MFSIEEKSSEDQLQDLFQEYFSASQNWKNLDEKVNLLTKIVKHIRPNPITDGTSLQPLLDLLQTNTTYLQEFKAFVEEFFQDRSFTEMIVNVGISSNDSFFQEFKRKITDQILPEMADSHKMRFVFSQVFHQKKDRDWVLGLDKEEVKTLVNLLRIKPIEFSFEEEGTMWQIYYAIVVIALRASGSALEKNVVNLTPNYQNKQSPFVALYLEIVDLWEKTSSKKQLMDKNDDDYKQIIVLIGQCRDYVQKALKGAESRGITLQTNKDLNRIWQQLDRIEMVLPLITQEKTLTSNVKITNLFYTLMDIHSRRKKLGEFFSDSTRLVALEISSHQAKTGEHYITATPQEYWNKFLSALGGGFIVGILCIIKVLLSKIDTSDFGHAFLYSMNYAIGFVAIYIFGATLATKHPAMTASAMTALIDKGMSLEVRAKFKYKAFARYFAQLFRTQFISFLGNVMMAFPTALLGVYLIYKVNGHDITQGKWQHLLIDLNPIHSLLILHAAIAGIFLFLSGLIAGEVANSNKFYGIAERLAHNPTIKWTLGVDRAKKLAQYHHAKWPNIMSNVWFGIFMGSIASVGAFLGLNLDIRHITFSAGNFGMGLFGANWEVGSAVILWSIIGIGIIGFINFIVSFGLSMLLAFKAKNLTTEGMRPIFQSIYHEFKTQPLSFLIPYTTTSGDEKIEIKTTETIKKIRGENLKKPEEKQEEEEE